MVQPSQGLFGIPYTVVVRITGPAASQVSEVDLMLPGLFEALPRQPDGSFQDRLAFAGVRGMTDVVSFAAYDERRNEICCGGTNVTSLGHCTNDGDCGAGGRCLRAIGLCFYNECLDDFECGVGMACLFNLNYARQNARLCRRAIGA